VTYPVLFASDRDGNLGPGERRKRLIFGAAALLGALGLSLTGFIGAFYQRLFLFLLFWLAALGLLQAREKT